MVGEVATHKLDIRWRWLFGQRADVCFFLVPIFIGITAYLCTLNPLFFQSVLFSVIIADAFEAGPFHQGPTLFAYFDKNNRNYFGNDQKKRRIFFLAPPLIMTFSIILYALAKELLILIWMLWAIQHFIQQNIGILFLYHNHRQGEAVVDRKIEIRSQWSACLFFFGLFFQRVLMKGEPNVLSQLWIYGALACALFYCGQYILELNKQVRNGAYINMPATLFWLFSVLSFIPFAFLGHSFYDAYLIPTTVHFFQYIGLNYMLAHNKYRTGHINNLAWQKPLLLLSFICCLTVGFNLSVGCISKSSELPSLIRDVARGAIYGLALCHFFLDAFIWRFRDSYLRESILPFLKQARS